MITAQETFEGWFALINRQKAGMAQTTAYAQFLNLPFDVFERLQEGHIRIGTMDLKVASICLAHEATLLTRNVVDFSKVPDLRADNWLD